MRSVNGLFGSHLIFMVPRGLSLIRIRLPGFRLALSDPVGGDILHRDPSFPAKEGDGSENVSEPALPLGALS